MAHIILLGDSIFDNLSYVQPEPDVLAQLQELLPAGWKASLRAVDGAVTNHVTRQLADLPADTTHLVTMSSQVFVLLAGVVGGFEPTYRRVVEACLETGLPLVVCTIYNGNFVDQEFQTMAPIAVAIFNDVILRVSREKGLQAIDLRLVCALEEDYANEIEPSAIGGRKIAAAIWRAVSDQEYIHKPGKSAAGL